MEIRTVGTNWNLKTNRGFSLIEMAMMLAIVGMAALIVSPSIMNVQRRMYIETEANDLRSKIREVQQKAINEQRAYGMDFSNTQMTDSYDIYYDSNGDDIPDFLLETIDIRKTEITVGPTTFTADFLIFDHFGAPNMEGYVLFANSQGLNIHLWVRGATGKIDLQWI